MIREDRDKLLLTVSQPDLALYRGPSDEAFDKDGNVWNAVSIRVPGLIMIVVKYL